MSVDVMLRVRPKAIMNRVNRLSTQRKKYGAPTLKGVHCKYTPVVRQYQFNIGTCLNFTRLHFKTEGLHLTLYFYSLQALELFCYKI